MQLQALVPVLERLLEDNEDKLDDVAKNLKSTSFFRKYGPFLAEYGPAILAGLATVRHNIRKQRRMKALAPWGLGALALIGVATYLRKR